MHEPELRQLACEARFSYINRSILWLARTTFTNALGLPIRNLVLDAQGLSGDMCDIVLARSLNGGRGKFKQLYYSKDNKNTFVVLERRRRQWIVLYDINLLVTLSL